MTVIQAKWHRSPPIANTIHTGSLSALYLQSSNKLISPKLNCISIMSTHLNWCFVLLLGWQMCVAFAWHSKDCPIENQDNRENYICIRPCDSEITSEKPNRNQYGKSIGSSSGSVSASSAKAGQGSASDPDSFFVVFFPPNSKEYEANRLKCPSGFKKIWENKSCFCERPYTPYELEMQRREKCDRAFEQCRMYGSKPYDCNNIVDACPTMMIRDYCIAGKVFKMRFATVVFEFCHAFLRLPNDGRRHLLEPDIDRLRVKH